PLEVLQAVRKAVGSEFPVVVRMSADEMVPNGLTPNDSIKIAKRLEELGADAIHVSVGNYASFNRGYMISPMDMPDAPLVPIAERVKRSVRVPVIAVGKIRSPALANEIIHEGKADFVAIGRPLLADPDWPKKAEEGRVGEIRKCIACNQGCIIRLFAGEDVWCTVNPETSRELEFAKPIPKAKKRVFIAGGGPAGMEAARVATLRGHKVVLFEEHDSMGGALILSSMLPYRRGWAELRDYLIEELNRLGVDVRLGTRATAELAKREGAEVAIVAVGASQFRVDIPGIERENVVLSRDILEGKASVLGKKVVVIGSGVSGAQIADFLAEKGYDVTIAAAGEEIARSAAVVIRSLLLERLKQHGVRMLTNTQILGIEKGKVLIKGPSGSESLPADTVVVSLGVKPNNSIASELQTAVKQVIVVGDAVEPRDATYAMVEGARAGLSI
ncbi:MAG: FAD-dependent oxidoreductase, partial [candidate division WOR-3 bacterium]